MVFEEEEEGGGVGGGGEEGEEERVFEGEKVVDSFEISLTNPRLFLQKTLVVVLASYAFIPVIYFFNEVCEGKRKKKKKKEKKRKKKQ